MSARKPEQPAGQLIDQLEGLQVQVVAGAGEQRLEIFEQRRHHQLVAVDLEQVEDAPAQRFDLPGRRRQDVLDVLGQEPAAHGK